MILNPKSKLCRSGATSATAPMPSSLPRRRSHFGSSPRSFADGLATPSRGSMRSRRIFQHVLFSKFWKATAGTKDCQKHALANQEVIRVDRTKDCQKHALANQQVIRVVTDMDVFNF
jgi:hypothetical protein